MPFRQLLGRSRGQRSPTNENGHPRFVYGQLGSDEIRVLSVSRTSARADEVSVPLLSLVHVSLTSPPTYTAISYMWGTRQDTTELIVDGCALQVRTSLKAMVVDLCQVRQSQNLWIDAICINQNDIEEKNMQVRRMGDIYSEANYVIAYLKGSNHPTYHATYLSGRSRRYLSLESTVACIREAISTRSFQAVKKGLDYERFFNNDYFVRRWIIQEVCLARSVIIRCDGSELSMDRLHEYFVMFGADHGWVDSRAANICDLRRQMLTGSSRFEDLLYDHKNAICRDRLDKVYALLSLSETAREHIVVDYTVTPLQLLLSVVGTVWDHQEIRRSRIVSFACFLRQTLRIDRAEFEIGLRNPTLRERNTARTQLRALLRVRGILRSRRVDAAIEDGLHSLRHTLPSIDHYHPIRLNGADTNYGEGARQSYSFHQDRDSHHDRGIKVHPESLWVFSCTSLDPGSTTLLAGTSSAAMQVDDEIWQFPRTPVALVARPSGSGYTLVARALVLNDKAWRVARDRDTALSSKNSSPNLEDMIDWIQEIGDDIDFANTKAIEMSTWNLLEMISWVDLFAD